MGITEWNLFPGSLLRILLILSHGPDVPKESLGIPADGAIKKFASAGRLPGEIGITLRYASPRWNSALRSCRAVLETNEAAAKYLDRRIAKENPGLNLIG